MVGIRGPLTDAKFVMNSISKFLETKLKLNLNKDKTLITHLQKDKALFLGTFIGKARMRTFTKISPFAFALPFASLASLAFVRLRAKVVRLRAKVALRQSKAKGQSKAKVGQPVRNPLKLRFEAPMERITKKLISASFIKNGRPAPRFLWMAYSKDQIINLYNSVLRGFLNYYSFVYNYAKMAGWIYMNLKSSCAKLLAAKYTLKSQNRVYRKYGKDLQGRDRIGFLKITYKIKPWDFKTSSKDYVKTLFTEKISLATFDDLVCSLCGSNYRVEMHHIRQLKDLNPKLSKLDALMAARRRKQIAVCRDCHVKFHSSKK